MTAPHAVVLFAMTLAADTPLARVIVCTIATIFGVAFIFVGSRNLRTGTAEESGKRRAVLRLFGKSSTYKGNVARAVGIIRIVTGVIAIVAAIVFAIFGSFLARGGPE